ncbi:MAG: 4Fe-4S binding protein [Dehalococcoidaceae bacterium]|nr:4Fe-4S binding protein [Dehalococcoidaceae bacterium]
MPAKTAIIDFNRCRPDECSDGVCPAALACRRKILVQEKPGEIPMVNPAICRSCSDCVRACPLNAIKITLV